MIGETKKLGDDVRALSSGSFIQLSKGLTHYKLDGPSDGNVVVFIHGIAGPFGIWTKVADSLMSHGFRILQYDLYGRGYSDRPDVNYDLDFYINQLSELLAVLSIRNPIYLVGWSLGGMIAVAYTAKYSNKIEKLILIAPAGVEISRPMNAKIAMVPFLGELLMGLFGRQMIVRFALKELHNDDLVDEFRTIVTGQMQYEGYLRSFLSTLRCCVFEDATKYYRTIGKLGLPVLMISGSEDTILKAAARNRIGELIPHLQYNEIRVTGHMPHFERPEEVRNLLINFVSPPTKQAYY
jgi:pimeloyl-ACP methyl ester carboxylesterase